MFQAHIELIRAHFNSIAGDYLRYKRKNVYYHAYLKKWCLSLVQPRSSALDVGCGRGELLSDLRASLRLKDSVGIDLSGEMIRHARNDHPDLVLQQCAVEDFKSEKLFDVALLINTIEYAYDPCKLLDRIHRVLRDDGRVLITSANPLWSAIFSVSSRLGLRIPDCKRLFLTNRDMRSMLGLNGFEIVCETQALILPKRIPLLTPIMNWLVPRIPFLRILCSTQLIVGRKIPMDRREYSVSIVIPCYNEVKNIARCVAEVPKLGSRTEVIFVDDGSKDGTADAVRAASRSDIDVRLISYSPNRGKGRAVTEGFLAARNDVLMIVDADLTTPAEDLETVYNAFADGRAEFVNCTRMIYPMENRAMKVSNFIGNKVFTSVVSAIIERRVTDTLCGTKAFFRRDFPCFKMGQDPWGDYDLLFSAGQLRLALREVPVHYRERIAGASKMKALSHGIQLVKLCFRGFFQIKMMRSLAPEPKKT